MLITSGALQGVNLCIQTFLNPGDEVIVLSPIYSPHLSRIVKKSDIIFKTCRLIYDENSNVFRMDFNHLKKNLTKKTRLLIIVNPCNPASNVWSK
jgi:cystathionine beta-lyase